ncbi:MAG: efflux RND transporter permease subunit [Desulfobacterales bacterium]|jgi:multidrug efflux pump|nr:efflux RND transporter permease subunit [Desulfobacterales bacterium]
MLLSDASVKRPVLAAVISLLLIVFGIVAFMRLPLREYPDIDPPVVSIETVYPGASAAVVETRITKLIEDRIAGVQGIRSLESRSIDGRSQITVTFQIDRDIDAAANDIRDRVAGVFGSLPAEADPPEIQKADADADVIIWFNLAGDGMSVMELSDYARRYLVDRFSSLDGVARVRLGGGLEYSMRIWVERNQLAARNLTVTDVENALRAENIELPAGNIESLTRDFRVRIQRGFQSVADFENLVLARSADGYLVRLRDVARVETGPVERRNMLRGNGVPMVGIGIIKQSKANTLAVARLAKAEAAAVNRDLPQGMRVAQSYDSSVFIESAIHAVYGTLFITTALVVLVIFLFLGSLRATLVPAVAVPVSLVATFIVLLSFDFTINLLTLLALVLAIGLVVDDAIVVLENIYRRIQLGEKRLAAAFKGTRQVGFAVIATTVVLVAVFVPITFLEGDVGRLFAEFAIAMSAAVCFSSLVALTLSPMIASKVLSDSPARGGFSRGVDRAFDGLRRGYERILRASLSAPWAMLAVCAATAAAAGWLFRELPSEVAPKEDRGAFFILVNAPEGSSFAYMQEHMNEIERRLMPLAESGEFQRLLIRAPRALGAPEVFNNGIGIVVLSHWDTGRRSAWDYMSEVRRRLADLTGVRAFPVMRQGLAGGVRKPVQFVIGGPSYAELAQWRDRLLAKAAENPKLIDLDHDYKETKPQLQVVIDRDRAGDLGVSVEAISRILESKLGSRRVTTFIEDGEEYDVLVEGEDEMVRSPADLAHIQVRSERSGRLIPLANLLHVEEFADSAALNRTNRIRSITIEAGLAEGYRLGQALAYLENLVKTELPPGVIINYKGESLDYVTSGRSVYFIFLLALVVAYLAMAALYESYVHPLVIMLTVPLAVAGALFGLYLTGHSLNIYSQIGMIMLVGLAAKNGILIVEFANQLRDAGAPFEEAIIQASSKRLRPILMTGVTTVVGALPLVLSSGAGSEARTVIGVVVIAGVLVATSLTLVIIPCAYRVLSRRASSPQATARELERQLKLGSGAL